MAVEKRMLARKDLLVLTMPLSNPATIGHYAPGWHIAQILPMQHSHGYSGDVNQSSDSTRLGTPSDVPSSGLDLVNQQQPLLSIAHSRSYTMLGGKIFCGLHYGTLMDTICQTIAYAEQIYASDEQNANYKEIHAAFSTYRIWRQSGTQPCNARTKTGCCNLLPLPTGLKFCLSTRVEIT
eukprot:scaffold145047_cov43-Prasinocladus_malaysianus.AAC.2